MSLVTEFDPVTSLANKYNLNSKKVISSSYWKVPDTRNNLTCVACHESDPLVAVASASKDSNIFIYEVSAPSSSSLQSHSSVHDDSQNDDDDNFTNDNKSYYSHTDNHRSRAIHGRKTSNPLDQPSSNCSLKKSKSTSNISKNSDEESDNHHIKSRSVSESLSSSSIHSRKVHYSRPSDRTPILTHHQTISLGGIHSIAWVPPKNQLSDYGNVIATGHSSGLVHLVMLPDPYINNGPAEILSRFNHTRHLSANSITSSRIRTLNIATNTWTCCPQSSILTMLSEHLFLWDPSRGDLPIIKQKTKKARSFHASPIRNGIVSLATDRGISIMDIRYKHPTALAPPTANDGLVSLVRWSPLDENRVASVHDQTFIKVWDIRAGAPLVTLDGHYDKINSIDWSVTNKNEFFSASSDSTVRLWDLEKCTENLDLSSGKPSVENTSSTAIAGSAHCAAPGIRPDTSGDWLPSKSWRLYRQRLAKDNSVPSYNYFLDNIQNSDSPCSTIFSNNKEYLGLGTVNLSLGGTGDYRKASRYTVPQMITIDSEGFFGLHSRLPSTIPDEEEDDSEVVDCSIYNSTTTKVNSEKSSSVEEQQVVDASYTDSDSQSDTMSDKGSIDLTASSPLNIPKRRSAVVPKKDIPYGDSGETNRRSLDSLASMSSKSSAHEGDSGLEVSDHDTFSDTSSLPASPAAAPSSLPVTNSVPYLDQATTSFKNINISEPSSISRGNSPASSTSFDYTATVEPLKVVKTKSNSPTIPPTSALKSSSSSKRNHKRGKSVAFTLDSNYNLLSEPETQVNHSIQDSQPRNSSAVENMTPEEYHKYQVELYEKIQLEQKRLQEYERKQLEQQKKTRHQSTVYTTLLPSSALDMYPDEEEHNSYDEYNNNNTQRRVVTNRQSLPAIPYLVNPINYS